MQLLTAKPVLYVCNVDENSVVSGNYHVDAVKEAVKDEDAEIIVLGAGIEADIAELESYEERVEFLEDLGLKEPGVAKLIQKAYSLLALDTYFTAGVKEVRAWTIPHGSTAPQAAGVIHTDFEKGFIRAEVIKYNDFVELGSEAAVKDAGKMRVEGKEYIVADADIMHFRFNV
jgi:ribosome-binding ATPase YchF (GTP1/OBG family)